jgi:hypothetical protein
LRQVLIACGSDEDTGMMAAVDAGWRAAAVCQAGGNAHMLLLMLLLLLRQHTPGV